MFHMKHCSNCLTNKPVPRQRWCKRCKMLYMREWRAAQKILIQGRARELRSLKDIVRRVKTVLAV